MLDSLIDEVERADLDYFIIDDSDKPIKYKKSIHIKKTGKKNFYKKWQILYDHLMHNKVDNILIIPDDFHNIDFSIFDHVKPKYFIKTIKDHRTNCWSPKQSELFNPIFLRDYFVDCTFACNRKTFLSLRKCPDDVYRGLASSGVGDWLTKVINRKAYAILAPINSFATHDDHPSVMHPETRKMTPIIANRHHPFLSIAVGIATHNNRDITKTLLSLSNQSIVPDKVYIYNNEKLPNLYSNGKFYGITKNHDLFLTCDDDIIYPYNYVKDMANHLIEYDVVTSHGRVLSGDSERYYYGGHNAYPCGAINHQSKQIDVMGTGVGGYNLKKIDLSNFWQFIHSYPNNMDDLVMSLFLLKQGIKPQLIPHEPFRIISHSQTIYNQMAGNDSEQVKIMKEFFDIKNKSNTLQDKI